jgi:hypothetical protein
LREEDAMKLQRTHPVVATLVLLAVTVLAVPAPGALVGSQPLRSGTVLTKIDVGDVTFVKAVDDTGKEFWVLITICTIGANGKIDVLEGKRHDKMKTKDDVVMEDVYIGKRVRIGEVEVVGFGPDKLPDGCVVME